MSLEGYGPLYSNWLVLVIRWFPAWSGFLVILAWKLWSRKTESGR